MSLNNATYQSRTLSKRSTDRIIENTIDAKDNLKTKNIIFYINRIIKIVRLTTVFGVLFGCGFVFFSIYSLIIT